MTRLFKSFVTTMTIPLVFLFLWNGIAHRIGNPVILPEVSEVGRLIFNPFTSLISMGSLTGNVLVSLARVLIGYGAAVILAVPIGVLMGYSNLAFSLGNNFLNLFRPIPPLAWVPLVMAWFGVTSLATVLGVEIGQWYIYLNNIKFSMIFIIFIGAFYPVLISAIYGVRNVRKVLIDSARVLGASELDIFRKILLPAAYPVIVNGMRIGLGIAWMCLVSAEMLPGSLSGVGYLITHAYTVARTDIVVAGMVSIGLVGALLDAVFQQVERRKFKWQRLAR
jgi:NitT/TauT family transport system permease protein